MKRICGWALGSAAALALLAGCVTQTPYQARGGNAGPYGYAEQRLESNRFRVTFSGNSSTPRDKVENYLLYRAAEVTLDNGYDYFVMANQDTAANTSYRQTLTGPYGFGYYDWYPHMGMGVATADPETNFDAQAVIVMFKGKKPDNDIKAFDARSVRDSLGPTIVRPQAKP